MRRVAGEVVTTRHRRALRERSANSAASLAGGSDNRLGVRLWCLLHAQVLIHGTFGPEHVALIEDDRRRLAGRRAW